MIRLHFFDKPCDEKLCEIGTKNQTPAFKANLLMEVFKGGQVKNLDREHGDPSRTQKMLDHF